MKSAPHGAEKFDNFLYLSNQPKDAALAGFPPGIPVINGAKLSLG